MPWQRHIKVKYMANKGENNNVNLSKLNIFQKFVFALVSEPKYLTENNKIRQGALEKLNKNIEGYFG